MNSSNQRYNLISIFFLALTVMVCLIAVLILGNVVPAGPFEPATDVPTPTVLAGIPTLTPTMTPLPTTAPIPTATPLPSATWTPIPAADSGQAGSGFAGAPTAVDTLPQEVIRAENGSFVLASSTLAGHAGPVTGVAFLSDGIHLVSADANGQVRVWNLTTARVETTLEAGAEVTQLAVSPDGSRVAVALRTGTITIWTLADVSQPLNIPAHQGAANSVAFSLDGRTIATGGDDALIKFWDASTGGVVAELAHNGAVRDLAYSLDGSRLASVADDQSLYLWDVASRSIVNQFPTAGVMQTVAYSRDGSRLVMGGEGGTIIIWDTIGNQVDRNILGSAGQVMSAEFNLDGSVIASASADNQIRIWVAASGTQLTSLPEHGSQVNTVAFSPSGSFIASGGGDRNVRLWAIPEGLVVEPTPEIPAATEEVTEEAGTDEGESDTAVTGCVLTATPRDANLRDTPNTDSAIIRQLPVDTTIVADAQLLGTDGFVWFRTVEGTWVRTDVVAASEACANLPAAVQ